MNTLESVVSWDVGLLRKGVMDIHTPPKKLSAPGLSTHFRDQGAGLLMGVVSLRAPSPDSPLS